MRTRLANLIRDNVLVDACRAIIEHDRFCMHMACLTPDSSIAEGIIQDCREISEESTLRFRDVFEYGASKALLMATWGTFSFAAWREHMRLWVRYQ